jgi:RNA polymerase sigma factor (TIGR02999 family)
MRRILVEHARGHTREKRGGDTRKVSLDEAALLADGKAANMVALDDALKSLAEFDSRKCQIVELKYFGGLNIDETAEVIGVSPATVKREWNTAKIWLHREIASASIPE